MTVSFRSRTSTVTHRYDTNRSLFRDGRRVGLSRKKPPRASRGWGSTGRGLCVLDEPPNPVAYTRPSPSGPRPSCVRTSHDVEQPPAIDTGGLEAGNRNREREGPAAQLLAARRALAVVAVALGFEPRVAMNHVVAGGCSTVHPFRFSALSQRFCYGEALGNCE